MPDRPSERKLADDEARKLEAALRESEAKLRAIVEHTPDAVTIKDLEGRYLLINPAGARNIGVPAEEVLGKTDAAFFPENLVREARAREREVIASGQSLTFDITLNLGGTARSFMIQKFPYRAADGGIVGVAGISREITDRKATEQALRESEERYRRLVELSPEAIVVDRNGELIYANPAGAKLLGVASSEKLLGRSLLEFIHPEDVVGFKERLERVREEGAVSVLFEERILRPDGEVVQVETTASPITYQGQPAVIAIIRDVTARNRAIWVAAERTAELKKAHEVNTLKDHFLSSVSHEMKTPLSLIMGYTELLEDTCPAKETEALVDGIKDGARRLKEHLDNVLDYSALLGGSLPLYKVEVNLTEIARNAGAILQDLFASKQLKFNLEVDPATPAIEADSRRVMQILLKLLENAQSFTPAGGSLGVRIGPAGGEVRIDVWDTGPGIRRKDFERVWEAFSQLEVGDAVRKGGLGLGLTIVKKLTELHGGRVALASEEGKGCVFSVYLPIGEGASPAENRR